MWGCCGVVFSLLHSASEKSNSRRGYSDISLDSVAPESPVKRNLAQIKRASNRRPSTPRSSRTLRPPGTRTTLSATDSDLRQLREMAGDWAIDFLAATQKSLVLPFFPDRRSNAPWNRAN